MMQRNHVEALATRDLLKADAARERKSSVVRVRKGVAAAKLPQGGDSKEGERRDSGGGGGSTKGTDYDCNCG
jgi:hypothetical protein